MKGGVVLVLPLLLRSSAFVSPRRQQKRGVPSSTIIYGEGATNGSVVNGSSKVNGSGEDRPSDKSPGTASVPSVGEVSRDGRLPLLQVTPLRSFDSR